MNPTVRVTKTSLICTTDSGAVTFQTEPKDMHGMNRDMHDCGHHVRDSYTIWLSSLFKELSKGLLRGIFVAWKLVDHGNEGWKCLLLVRWL